LLQIKLGHVPLTKIVATDRSTTPHLCASYRPYA